MKQLYNILFFLILPLFFFSFQSPANVVAQDANFELAERFTSEQMQKMTGNTFLRARWIEDEDRFWYDWEDPNGKRWEFVDAGNQSRRPLFDRHEMAAQLAKEFNRGFNAKDLDLKEFDYDTERGLFTFHVDSVEFKYHINRDELVKGDSLKPDDSE